MWKRKRRKKLSLKKLLLPWKMLALFLTVAKTKKDKNGKRKTIFRRLSLTQLGINICI